MSAPNNTRRKSRSPELRAARQDTRSVAAPTSVSTRGYPSAEELFAQHSLWRSRVAGALRTWLGPAAFVGAVGLAGCGGTGGPPVAEPNADGTTTTSTGESHDDATGGHQDPTTPGQAISPTTDSIPLGGAPMPVQPPSQPSPPPSGS